jgi:putative DNA primase/helicase
VTDKGEDLAGKIAEALGGSPLPDSRGNYLCHCPSHTDSHPSLAVGADGDRVLFYCRAGCSQSAVLEALKRRGLLPGKAAPAAHTAAHASPVQHPRPTPDPFRMWRGASPDIDDSLVALYLRKRGLLVPKNAPLRYAPFLFHWPSKHSFPAMVALIRRYDGAAITAHATFIGPDGSKALVDPVRLFAAGANPAGGGVWFRDLGEGPEGVIAEGIESALSAAQLYGASAAVATLSTHGMRSLIVSPTSQRPLRIFADHDAAGHGLAAARDLYRRLRSAGRNVALSMANTIGHDANDILRQRSEARS